MANTVSVLGRTDWTICEQNSASASILGCVYAKRHATLLSEMCYHAPVQSDSTPAVSKTAFKMQLANANITTLRKPKVQENMIGSFSNTMGVSPSQVNMSITDTPGRRLLESPMGVAIIMTVENMTARQSLEVNAVLKSPFAASILTVVIQQADPSLSALQVLSLGPAEALPVFASIAPTLRPSAEAPTVTDTNLLISIKDVDCQTTKNSSFTKTLSGLLAYQLALTTTQVELLSQTCQPEQVQSRGRLLEATAGGPATESRLVYLIHKLNFFRVLLNFSPAIGAIQSFLATENAVLLRLSFLSNHTSFRSWNWTASNISRAFSGNQGGSSTPAAAIATAQRKTISIAYAMMFAAPISGAIICCVLGGCIYQYKTRQNLKALEKKTVHSFSQSSGLSAMTGATTEPAGSGEGSGSSGTPLHDLNLHEDFNLTTPTYQLAPSFISGTSVRDLRLNEEISIITPVSAPFLSEHAEGRSCLICGFASSCECDKGPDKDAENNEQPEKERYGSSATEEEDECMDDSCATCFYKVLTLMQPKENKEDAKIIAGQPESSAPNPPKQSHEKQDFHTVINSVLNGMAISSSGPELLRPSALRPKRPNFKFGGPLTQIPESCQKNKPEFLPQGSGPFHARGKTTLRNQQALLQFCSDCASRLEPLEISENFTATKSLVSRVCKCAFCGKTEALGRSEILWCSECNHAICLDCTYQGMPQSSSNANKRATGRSSQVFQEIKDEWERFEGNAHALDASVISIAPWRMSEIQKQSEAQENKLEGHSVLDVGSRIIANWKNKGIWYAGTISAVTGEGFSVAYDAGSKEDGVNFSCVKPTQGQKNQFGSLNVLGVGSRISANWKKKGTWFAGTISAVTQEGFSITYDAGSKEDGVDFSCIKPMQESLEKTPKGVTSTPAWRLAEMTNENLEKSAQEMDAAAVPIAPWIISEMYNAEEEVSLSRISANESTPITGTQFSHIFLEISDEQKEENSLSFSGQASCKSSRPASECLNWTDEIDLNQEWASKVGMTPL